MHFPFAKSLACPTLVQRPTLASLSAHLLPGSPLSPSGALPAPETSSAFKGLLPPLLSKHVIILHLTNCSKYVQEKMKGDGKCGFVTT